MKMYHSLYNNLIKFFKRHSVVLFVLLLVLVSYQFSFASEIGDQARERAKEIASGPREVKPEQVIKLSSLVQTLSFVLLLLVLVFIIIAARLVKFDPFKFLKANQVQALITVAFGALFLGFVYWQIAAFSGMPTLYKNAASEHGKDIDGLFQLTIAITMVVFVVLHILLFYFIYKYRATGKTFALFYPDNHKLEILWTIIPAVGLVFMVGGGLRYWYNVNHPNEQELAQGVHLELVGEQFKWNLRYAGNDKKLGKATFRKISDTNPIGLDSTDSASRDDIVPQAKEIHLPINQLCKIHIRSKDVLHGVYMPHFRVNMYAVPGMPTEFVFRPTKTTEEMRKETGNPNFHYELACSQLCGISHWNMKMIVVVESEQDYKKWLAAQPVVDPNSVKQLAKK